MVAIRHVAVVACLVSAVAWSTAASAQTWIGPRTRPSLREIVAIDATGEPGWPFGAEDIAGDGVQTFEPAEMALDIRTAYARADDEAFRVRIYVSDPDAARSDLVAYVFVDADSNAATGGSAAVPAIHPSLDTDPSNGGYEYIIGIRGDGTVDSLREHRGNAFVAIDPLPPEVVGEAGRDVDPIRIGAVEHGYVQAAVPLDVVDLTPSCQADLFVRSVSDSDAMVASDVDVGQLSACVPADADDDAIPDLVDDRECTSDAQCPIYGVCIRDRCVVAVPCSEDGDCDPGEECTDDGICVATGGDTCDTSADCDGLVCDDGQCVPCSESTCAEGQTCGPDGRCIEGENVPGTGGRSGAGGSSAEPGPEDLIDEGEEVQGGACACRTGRARGGAELSAVLLALGLSLAFAFRRSTR